jgi:septum formation protein
MKKLVLASVSPRRKEILQMVGFTFRIAKSNIDEKFNPRLQAKGQAEFLSRQKAEAVAERYVDAIVIGVDEVISLGGEVLGKPTSPEQAKKMLSRLSGKAHLAITAFTIIDSSTKKSVTKSVETKVYMKYINRKEIEWYIRTGEPFDKSGGYAIQGKGSVFIEKIEGDYFNVVGLPIFELVEELKKFDITLF